MHHAAPLALWQPVADTVSGKVFYWNSTTGERVWEKPAATSGGGSDASGASPPVRPGTHFRSTQDAASGLTFYVDVATSETVWDLPEDAVVVSEEEAGGGAEADADAAAAAAAAATAGAASQWASAVDPASGKTYYYNADGETRWEAPTDA